MAYQVFLHRLFAKEILKLPSHQQQTAYQILTLINQPVTLPTNTIALAGSNNLYRTRLGQFRLIYQIDHQNQRIVVLGIGSLGNIYKHLRKLVT